MTPHSPASSPELPKLPDLPLAYYAADYIRAYATAHGLACYEAGRASHAAPTVPVDAVVGEPVAKTDDEILALFGSAIGHEPASNWRTLKIWGQFFSYAEIIKAIRSILVASMASRAQTEPENFVSKWSRVIRDMPSMYEHPAAAPTPTQVAEAPKAAPQAVVGEASAPNYLNWVLHPRTADLVLRFSYALAGKLSAAEKKYGYNDGWAESGWMDECREKLMEHIDKGDPRDVAAYCAFLWHHGESTAGAKPLMKTIADLAAVFDEGVRQGAALTPYPAPSAAPQEADALREDAERYRYLRQHRDVLLATGFFGNGCVNKYRDDVDAAIDAARAALAQHQPPQQGEQQ